MLPVVEKDGMRCNIVFWLLGSRKLAEGGGQKVCVVSKVDWEVGRKWEII